MSDDNNGNGQVTEIRTTKTWSSAIMVTIVLQTLGFVWYAAQLDQQVKQNTKEITELQNNTTVLISREQLNDLLGGRDQKISNIENAISRIETKLDRAIK